MNRKLLSALVLILIAGLAALTTISGMNQKKTSKADKQGHVLTELWSKYYKAEKADLPQQEEDALSAIAEEAKNQRCAWDFYDAVTRKANVISQRNWKDRAKAEDELSKAVGEYDDPLLTYLLNVRNDSDGFWADSAKIYKNKLSAFRRDDFYTRCNNSSVAWLLKGLIPDAIRNDYEFVLWNELARHSGRYSESESYPLLSSEVEGTYPAGAFLKFLSKSDQIALLDCDYAKCISLCNEYIDEYSGKAVSLLAKSMLLGVEKDSLDAVNAASAQYRRLYDEASKYYDESGSYVSKGGIESKIAWAARTDFIYFRQDLTSKNLSVEVKEDTALVIFRNMENAVLSFSRNEKNAKPLLTKTVVDPVKSFYVQDTVKVKLNCKDDGDYIVRVKNGKISSDAAFSRHRLSIAVRGKGKDFRFYVADWKSGEPEKVVDLNLYVSGNLAASAKDVAVDGFTPLPDAISSKLAENVTAFVEASCKDADGYVKNSARQDIYPRLESLRSDGSESEYCNILTDKKAFNPGESVKFKAVLYQGDLRKRLSVIPAGRSVKAELIDSEGKAAGSLELTTNEYGSVAGELEIPKDRRNGGFRLVITDGKFSSDCYLTVGEYVLPTFDVTFDDIDTLYFEGDTVTVRGHLESYSGHSLSSARATYEVGNFSQKLSGGKVDVASDGSFEISCPPAKDNYLYRFTVKVVDQTGETQEFSKVVYVVNSLNLGMSLRNSANGSVQFDSDDQAPYFLSGMARYGQSVLISDDVAKVVFSVRNSSGVNVRVPVKYSLKDASGKVLKAELPRLVRLKNSRSRLLAHIQLRLASSS